MADKNSRTDKVININMSGSYCFIGTTQWVACYWIVTSSIVVIEPIVGTLYNDDWSV